MSDTELSDAEATRLRQLLHRAADSLPIDTPDVDTVDLRPAPERSRRGRWMFAAAAVLVVVIAAAGAVVLLSGEDADRIDTGPAEPPVTVAPQVREQTGVWRLPEGLDGYTVVGAQDAGSYDSSSAEKPGAIAVDSTDEPTRWLLVQAYDELNELEQLPDTTRQVALSDEVTMTIVPTAGSTWFRLTPTGDPVGVPVLSGSALGIDEAELTALLAERFSTVTSLAAASGSSGTMEALLDDAGFGADRLVWQGRGDGGPASRNQQVQVSLAGDDGSEVAISLNRGSDPPWSVAVRLRMSAELYSMTPSPMPGGLLSVRHRPELGPNVLESSSDLPGQPAAAYLTAISDDGTWISAYPTVTTATGLEPASPASLTEEQQLRIINSLRSMSEDDFRARLTELGAEFIGPDSTGTTTTLQGGPGG